MRVTVDLSGLRGFARELRSGLRGESGPVRDAVYQWAVRYRAAMQRRFNEFSRGGGDWPPLAESTIIGRRHGKGGRFKRGKGALARARATGGGQVSILRDTGTLFGALTPAFVGVPGQHQQHIPNGIAVGFGGPAKHPRGVATIAGIAEYHQEGSGKLPKREILVPPSDQLMLAMTGDMERAIRKLSAQNR